MKATDGGSAWTIAKIAKIRGTPGQVAKSDNLKTKKDIDVSACEAWEKKFLFRDYDFA